MSNNLIEITPSAYDYPLLIKHLLHAPLVRSPDQVIVYRERRHTYRQFRDRLGRLASALTDLGVKAGDVVAVSGLGQPPLPRMLLRDPHDGRCAADGEPGPAA